MTKETSQTLAERLAILLPDQYQDPARAVAPVSMGSAGLKFGADGRVAWDQIWGSFCDLAMAGGPPHRGTLLQPGRPAAIVANRGSSLQAAEEIARGITLVTGLEAAPSRTPGWVRVDCPDPTMAGWLTRAIAMENIAVRCEGPILLLPAGPDYRLEREIKNVITATAKTCHYWSDHTSPSRRRAMAALFAESPLIQPAPGQDPPTAHFAEALPDLRPMAQACPGWLGFECHSIAEAIWLMRAIATANILSRREEAVVFVAVNPSTDPGGARVVAALSDTLRLQG